jgi:hypothetical protein
MADLPPREMGTPHAAVEILIHTVSSIPLYLIQLAGSVARSVLYLLEVPFNHRLE